VKTKQNQIAMTETGQRLSRCAYLVLSLADKSSFAQLEVSVYAMPNATRLYPVFQKFHLFAPQVL
jgi:hypothetical protein